MRFFFVNVTMSVTRKTPLLKTIAFGGEA